MDTIIVGQGYNLQENTSVAKMLIELFNSKRYESFTCLVAFASYSGVSALRKYIKDGKKHGMKAKVILGIDQKGTSKEALEEVLSWDIEAYIYHTDSRNIFHPKVYLFENIDIFTLIVGSNNLTVPGLVENVECSLMIKDVKENSVYADFYKYWKNILDGSEENLYPLTKELIENLFKDKIIPSETERAKRYDNGSTESDSVSTTSLKFKRQAIQSLPLGFRPSPRKVKVKKVTKKDSQSSTVTKEKTLYVGEEVLIAEIGGGPRWKQVNFPVDIFENFFGAERGNNNYQIELMNIAKDGSLGEVETRQAVSVKSKNYRFEINCAETAGIYPGNKNRPIGLFVKLDSTNFLYSVLMPGDKPYKKIKKYLYEESKNNKRELKRAIVHIEAIHALYPELIL